MLSFVIRVIMLFLQYLVAKDPYPTLQAFKKHI